MAFSLPSFHCRGSTKAYRKIGQSGRGRQLGVPLADAFIRKNKRLLSDTSPEFRDVCLSPKTGCFPCLVKHQVKHINFAMKRAAHLVHHAKFQYNINKTMRQEIEFFREKLLPESNIAWETSIAHIIPRTPTFTSFGDSCLEGAGEYCISLGFWWHIPFPEAVIQHTLKHKKITRMGSSF